jgi:hypothetical protein
MLELASIKRIVLGVAVVAALALFVTSGLPRFLGMFLYVGVFRSVFPSAVTWDAHEAFVKCGSAVEHPSEWPSTAAAACQAMHMCANEAPLSDEQRDALYTEIRGTPGCRIP